MNSSEMAFGKSVAQISNRDYPALPRRWLRDQWAEDLHRSLWATIIN